MILSSSYKKKIIILTIISAIFIEYIDATIIVIALPILAKAFKIKLILTKLILCSYFIGLGLFVPLCSYLSDFFGSKIVLCISIFLFILGSLICALSQLFLVFLIARLIQGIAGAMMVPAAKIILFQSIKKEDYLKIVSLITIPVLLGPIIGPVIGGYIITYYSWQWIFIINIPIGFLTLLFVCFLVKNIRHKPSTIDWKGYIYLAIGFTFIIISGLFLDGSFISPLGCCLIFCIGFISMYLYYVHTEKCYREGLTPLIDLTFFKKLTFKTSILSSLFYRMGLSVIPFLLPLMLQEKLNFSPFIVGILITSSAIGGMIMKSISPRILRKYGYKRVLFLNACLSTIVISFIGFLEIFTFIPLIVLNIFFVGFSASLQFVGLNTILYADTNRNDIAQVSNIATIIQQIAPSLGIAVISICLQLSKTFQNSLSIGNISFIPIFISIGLLLFISAFFIKKLQSNAGENLLK